MLAPEEDMEISALRKRGWSISAIARHVGRDRKTVRSYLAGGRQLGVRRRAAVDPFNRVEAYVRQRLVDDRHVWATVLFDEVVALGYDRSYQTFTRKLREHRLRPRCEACRGVSGRATVDIEHPPGKEIQWDWLELTATPWGAKAFVLVGALAHSSKFRAWITDGDDQAHLSEGIDAVLRRLGGTARVWRVDRMATVINPHTHKVQASFAPVAKHYGVTVVACPPRRGNRKGVVEKNIHYLTQRWWRTTSATTVAEAQADLDRFCLRTADRRLRVLDDPEAAGTVPSDARRGDADNGVDPGTGPKRPPRRVTVGEAAAGEPLLELPPVPYPAVLELTRTVQANALVSVRGNRYSVPPGLVGVDVTVQHRIGSNTIAIVTTAGTVAATHPVAPAGAGRTSRLPEHTTALEKVVLAAFSTDRPCNTKVNRPPSPAALAIAADIIGDRGGGADPVIDLAVYQRHIDRNAAQGGA